MAQWKISQVTFSTAYDVVSDIHVGEINVLVTDMSKATPHHTNPNQARINVDDMRKLWVVYDISSIQLAAEGLRKLADQLEELDNGPV